LRDLKYLEFDALLENFYTNPSSKSQQTNFSFDSKRAYKPPGLIVYIAWSNGGLWWKVGSNRSSKTHTQIGLSVPLERDDIIDDLTG